MSIAGRRKRAGADATVPATPTYSTARIVYRHFTGLEYDGIKRTNATWTERGNKVLVPSGRAPRWNYRPRVQRAGIRWGWTAAGAGEGYAAIVNPELASAMGLTGLTTGGAWVAYRSVRGVVSMGHRRRVVRPMAKALARPLENDPANILREMTVPLRTERRDATIVIPVPDNWHGDRNAVESIVRTRLGGTWDAEWRMGAAPFSVVFTRSPEPPGRVTWSEMLDHIAANRPGEIVVGLDSRSKPVRGDFVREEPMWGLSIGSGGGKSVFLWCTAAQLVKQGARIVAIDPKYVSLDPLVGVPGIEVHNDPRNVQAMWGAIRRFREEMEYRFEQWTKDRSLEFERMVLIIEEGNMFSDISKDYWREIKKKGDPAHPPVWGDIAAILRMGRQANANVIAVFQRMDDASTGGRGLRDSFGFRMLGRYSWQAWRMLVNTTPIPRSQKHRGRFIVVDGGIHTWVQAPYATEKEIRDYCLAARAEQGWGAPLIPPQAVTEAVTSRGESESDLERHDDLSVTRDGGPHLTLVKDTGSEVPAEPRYSLAAAAREGIVPMKADALRQAKRRPGFPPAGEDGKWTADELRDWYERTRGGKASGE